MANLIIMHELENVTCVIFS